MPDTPTPHTGTDLTPRTIPDLLDDIERRAPGNAEIWYGHSILTSTLFPSTKPAPGTEYVSKSNGRMEYLLEAGIDSDHQRRFPYGKYPRLIMAWLAKQIRRAGRHRTEYVDPETHTITIPSIWQLCEEMGVAHGGRTAEAVQEQLGLLLSCRISVRRSTDTGFRGRRVSDVVYLPLVEAVRTVDDTDAGWSGASFVLTGEVYRRLSRESAPFDTRASGYLLSGRSVLPYDVYVWLAGSMDRLDHDLPVGWDWLMERFGDSFSNEHNFRNTFRRALEKVRRAYPAVNVTADRHGIVLHPSPTPVPSRRAQHAIDGGTVAKPHGDGTAERTS